MTAGEQQAELSRSASGGQGFAIVVADDERARVASYLAATAIQVLDLACLDRLAVQHDPNGNVLAIELPGVVLGSVVLSSAAAQVLADREASLATIAGTFGAPALDLSRSGEKERQPALLSWTIRRIAEIGSLILADSARVRAGLAVLRREHDEAMERFQQLEWSVSRAGTPQRILKLHFAPGAACVRIGGEASGHARGVRQLLPIHGSGLAYIELFTDTVPIGSEVRARFSLHEGGRQVATQTWDVVASDFRIGSLPLFMERALISRERNMILDVTWTGSAEGSMALQLGAPLALDEYCGTLPDGSLLSGPIAIKLWEMPPGSAVAEPEPVPVADERGAEPPKLVQRSRLALPRNDLEAVERLAPSDWDAGFNIVEFRRPEFDILVHPVQDRTVVAVARDVSWRNIERLSALVQVARRESNPVEFGLAAVTGGQNLDHPEQLIRHWTVVEPDQLVEVGGTVDISPGSTVDLLLATRMHENASPNLAWALFKRIEVVV